MKPPIAGFELSCQQKSLSLRPSHADAGLTVRIDGPLDSARLQKAFHAIVGRHEILRTTYQRSAGMIAPFQVVHETAQPELQTTLNEVDSGRWVYTVRLPGLSADLASLHLLFGEIARAYQGAAMEETVQYADYAQWQAELLERDDEEAVAARAYWKERNCSVIPALALPFQKKQSGHARESVAVNMGNADPDTLMSAWQILLWRLSGQSQVVVGRVAEGRGRTELTGAIGLYEKIVPECSGFESDISFSAATIRSQKAREETALFEDFFVPDDGAETEFTAGFSVEARPQPVKAGALTFTLVNAAVARPFALELRHTGADSAHLVFDPARFAAAEVRRLAGRLAIVLTAAPGALASELPVMDGAERTRILAYNNTAAEYPRSLCIQQLFEACAAETPAATALRFGETALTYARLNERANSIAHVLRARGVKPDVPVGLLTERSADMIVGLLAIIKAGGCYVPLMPDHPAARLERQIAETGAPVVLTQPGLIAFAGKTLYLDDEAFLHGNTQDLPLLNKPSDLAYVIYTSGSTGEPKGVAVTHGNLVNYTTFLLRRIQAHRWSFATVSTLGADLGNTCVFPALLSGGCLHVVGFETSMDPASYAAYSAKHSIDVLKITPSHLAALLDGAGPAVLPRRFLISGGEALNWTLLNRINGSGCRALNHYGPTEATIGCCTFMASDGMATDGPNADESGPLTVPVGRPVDNAEVYILDSRRQLVPEGAAGELCVAGDGVARGYLNRPRETSERFVPNPFSDQPDRRLYCTGDLARFLPGGDIEFLGRIDQQVKIRGFRVEPAEVETALRKIPGVRQAVVVAEGNASGEKTLTAYATGSPLESAHWRRLLSEYLPEYMLPARLVWVEALPLTSNGKVDIRALAALSAVTALPEASFAVPRTPDEEKMAAIWTEILKLDRIGIHDNFFELGGHSLLATQIVARVRKIFKKQIPLHMILQTPTIADLTARLDSYPEVEDEDATMARLLQELDGISEEEAQMLLAAEMQNPHTGPSGPA